MLDVPSAVVLHPVVCFGWIKAYSMELSTAIVIKDEMTNNAAHAQQSREYPP